MEKNDTYMPACPYPAIVLHPWPGCSKLMTSLVSVLLKFQTLISEICPYFLLKKTEKLLYKSFSHFFFNKNISVFSYKVVKHIRVDLLTSSLS